MDKDTNVDYTMKNQVIFNSPRSHCEERNDEAIQLRFLTMFGMTLRVRLLRGVYTEFNEVLAMTKRGVIAITGKNLWNVTGNYQIKSTIGEGY